MESGSIRPFIIVSECVFSCVVFCLERITNHLSTSNTTVSADGVVKLDKSDFGDRKGNIHEILQTIFFPVLDDRRSLNFFDPSVFFDSVCAVGLCLPLRQRWPGRDGSVLQERHLDQPPPAPPREPQTHPQPHAWNPDEEGRRRSRTVLLRRRLNLCTDDAAFVVNEVDIGADFWKLLTNNSDFSFWIRKN